MLIERVSRQRLSGTRNEPNINHFVPGLTVGAPAVSREVHSL
jgi:hypothetical protein